MICPRCRTENASEAAFCVSCGRQLSPVAGGRRKGLAITALVLGIVSYPLLIAFGAGFLTAVAAIVCGIVALVRISRAPREFGGKGPAIAGLVAGSVIMLLSIPMIIAAIAIPSLLRARTAANEAAAVGDLRTLISAEAAYASANRGYFDKLDCLAQPQSCIPGDTTTVPMISAPVTTEPTRRGYQFALHLGPAATPDDADSVSPSSVTGYAYVAVPVVMGRTGMRAFCGDETGVIRSSTEGVAPVIVDGKCPESWAAL